ncbi:C-terminal processing peptidase [Trifolium repens]|nr:C-terminal processing peptidase [Trifolium repens]
MFFLFSLSFHRSSKLPSLLNPSPFNPEPQSPLNPSSFVLTRFLRERPRINIPGKTLGQFVFFASAQRKRLDGIDSEGAAQRLRGNAGTTVTVKVKDSSKNSFIRQVKLPREYIKLSPISSAIIPHKSSAMKKFGVLY